MKADRLDRALRALAAYDRRAEAPEDVELRVMAGFRRARRRQLLWKSVVGSLVAAAAVGVVMLAPWRVVEQTPEPLADARGSVLNVDTVAAAVPPSQVVPPRPRVAARRVRQPVAPAAPREVVTEFFPLMDVMPPTERAEVWRVTVPASTLRTVGLPVNPDRWSERIQADVLVGEEGMARAIRFVSYQY